MVNLSAINGLVRKSAVVEISEVIEMVVVPSGVLEKMSLTSDSSRRNRLVDCATASLISSGSSRYLSLN